LAHFQVSGLIRTRITAPRNSGYPRGPRTSTVHTVRQVLTPEKFGPRNIGLGETRKETSWYSSPLDDDDATMTRSVRIADSFISCRRGIPIHLSSKHGVVPPIPELTPLTPPTRPPFLSLSMISVASCVRSSAVAPNARVQKPNFGISRAVYAPLPAQSPKKGLFARYELRAPALAAWVVFWHTPQRGVQCLPLFSHRRIDRPSHTRALVSSGHSSSVCAAARAARGLGP
jgi:hypothetical protein